MNIHETQQKNELPDAFSLFKPSWNALKLNLETFIWQLLLPAALVGLGIIAGIAAVAINDVVVYILFGLLAIVLLCACVVVTASLVVSELYSARGQSTTFKQVVSDTRKYLWRLVGLFIICAIIVTVGFILLIVPGLFAMQRLLLAPYILVDQDAGVREALRRSWRAGRKFSGPIWGIIGIVIAINLVGWVPVVGWIFSLALTVAYLCAPAIRYTQIATATQQSTPVKA